MCSRSDVVVKTLLINVCSAIRLTPSFLLILCYRNLYSPALFVSLSCSLYK